MKKYKVKIEFQKCLGCSVCSSLSPDTIKMSDETGLINIKDFKEDNNFLFGEISEDQLENFEAAAGACPQMIIKIQK